MTPSCSTRHPAQMLKANLCSPIPPGIDASKTMKISFYYYLVQKQKYYILITSLRRVSLKTLGLHRSRNLRRNFLLVNNISELFIFLTCHFIKDVLKYKVSVSDIENKYAKQTKHQQYLFRAEL